MARPSLTDEQRREIRRSIRAAAAKLHAENGMKDISARSIAESAGVSVGTIYSHFGSLTELMQSLWKQPARGMIDELLAVSTEHIDPAAKLRKLFDVYARFAIDNWSVYKGAFMFVRPDHHAPPPQIGLSEDRMFSIFRTTIADAQAANLIRKGNPEEITQTLWAGLHGAIALPTNFHRLALDDSEKRISNMLDLLFDWLQSPPPQA